MFPLTCCPEVRAVVIHRQQNTFERERGIQHSANAIERGHEVGDASSAKYSQLSGMRTRSAATSPLSVSKPSEGGVSIEDVIEVGAKRVDEWPQAAFAIDERHEFDFRASEMPVRRHEGTGDRQSSAGRNADGRDVVEIRAS